MIKSEVFVNSLHENYRRNIKEFGFSVVGVFGASESLTFTYTIGFNASYGQPELLVIGLHPRIAAGLFHSVNAWLKEGQSLVDKQVDHSLVQGGLALAFRAIPASAAERYMFQAQDYYKRDFPTMQIVWSDPAGVLPWEQGWDASFDSKQPRLWEETE